LTSEPVSLQIHPVVGYRQDVFTAMTALGPYLMAASSVYAADFEGWPGDAQRRAAGNRHLARFGRDFGSGGLLLATQLEYVRLAAFLSHGDFEGLTG
jgi:hypothetical protein